jgi:hypothetical protein
MGKMNLGFTLRMMCMKPLIAEDTVFTFQLDDQDEKLAIKIMNEIEKSTEAILKKHKVEKLDKDIRYGYASKRGERPKDKEIEVKEKKKDDDYD